MQHFHTYTGSWNSAERRLLFMSESPSYKSHMEDMEKAPIEEAKEQEKKLANNKDVMNLQKEKVHNITEMLDSPIAPKIGADGSITTDAIEHSPFYQLEESKEEAKEVMNGDGSYPTAADKESHWPRVKPYMPEAQLVGQQYQSPASMEGRVRRRYTNGEFYNETFVDGQWQKGDVIETKDEIRAKHVALRQQKEADMAAYRAKRQELYKQSNLERREGKYGAKRIRVIEKLKAEDPDMFKSIPQIRYEEHLAHMEKMGYQVNRDGMSASIDVTQQPKSSAQRRIDRIEAVRRSFGLKPITSASPDLYVRERREQEKRQSEAEGIQVQPEVKPNANAVDKVEATPVKPSKEEVKIPNRETPVEVVNNTRSTTDSGKPTIESGIDQPMPRTSVAQAPEISGQAEEISDGTPPEPEVITTRFAELPGGHLPENPVELDFLMNYIENNTSGVEHSRTEQLSIISSIPIQMEDLFPEEAELQGDYLMTEVKNALSKWDSLQADVRAMLDAPTQGERRALAQSIWNNDQYGSLIGGSILSDGLERRVGSDAVKYNMLSYLKMGQKIGSIVRPDQESIQ